MKTSEEIKAWFSLGNSEEDKQTLFDLLMVQKAGARHGMLGWYRDGDYSSDADWVYGVGARIQALESVLGDDDGSVFAIYQDAHSESLQEESESTFDASEWARAAQCDNASDGSEGHMGEP